MQYKLGLLAKDIHNSVLPHTYNYFGKCLGYDICFEIFNVPQYKLDVTIEKLKHLFNGFTVTMPYKVKILEYCDEFDISVEKCGSANTILVKNEKLIAYNTDGWGLVKSLSLKGHSLQGKKIVMVGAGGVALSIAYYLSINSVAKVDVFNIFEEETNRLVSKMGPLFTGHKLTSEALNTYAKEADYFINASVLGQIGYDDFTDLSFIKLLNPNAIVFDVNYSNPDAKLPKAAAENGLCTYIGKSMSICQGIKAMGVWTGREPSDEDVKKLISIIESDDSGKH